MRPVRPPSNVRYAGLKQTSCGDVPRLFEPRAILLGRDRDLQFPLCEEPVYIRTRGIVAGAGSGGRPKAGGGRGVYARGAAARRR